jgi:ribonucleotide reductase beta subunit family protein with ferritin-like domain
MHWIILKFERKSIVIKFAKLIVGKLRKAIANIFFNSISPNFKREIETIINNIIMTIIKEKIGLNYYKKLFAICGDNVLNNNTFCNYLYNLLLHNYNNDPILNTGLPKCYFYSRLSRI